MGGGTDPPVEGDPGVVIRGSGAAGVTPAGAVDPIGSVGVPAAAGTTGAELVDEFDV